jgi:hypothetical protein
MMILCVCVCVCVSLLLLLLLLLQAHTPAIFRFLGIVRCILHT